jgi:2-amino-4-hydroxy-6-hydroxymethyldihydropteridine diphosphokinase
MTNQCAIALGSNLGDSLAILENAVKILTQTASISLKSRSSWYKTKPIGPPQPDYLNGCLTAKVTLAPETLLENLLNIERQFGRVREEKWGPRTLDLDLILYDDLILDTPQLQLPHPRMRERAFVLVPLAAIAPDWVDPVTKLTMIKLQQQIDSSDIEILNE